MGRNAKQMKLEQKELDAIDVALKCPYYLLEEEAQTIKDVLARVKSDHERTKPKSKEG